MSTNSEEMGKGGNADHAPRLQPAGAGYAAWRRSMDVFLQRGGAQGVHKKALMEDEWTKRSKLVDEWADEAEADAWALISPVTSIDGSSSSTSGIVHQCTRAKAAGIGDGWCS